MSLFTHTMAIQGLGGGILIGIAASTMLLGLGRIAGVSGLTARAVGLAGAGAPRDIAVAFVLGLPLGAAILGAIGPIGARIPTSPVLLVVSGLLVGVGTRVGSGCTSGHGVCGVSRLSTRSLAATATFLLAGVATVTIMRLLGTA